MGSLTRIAEQLQRHYDTLITGDIHPVDHPVAKGDAREHGWRELLRRFLPDRYGVKSGFILDSLGKRSEQVDCIVYRKDMGIELYSVGHHTVIPVEAVFAAFEVKPIINKKALDYAHDKAISVANLEIANFFNWNKKGGLKRASAEGAIIFGLLADSLSWKKKWEVKPIKHLLGGYNTKISLFMTVEDGCVDTFSTGYPTRVYTFCDGKYGMFNQLIRLAESVAKLEEARCMSSCCLTEYKGQLEKPKKMKV